MNTGLESFVDEKVEVVEAIHSASDKISFSQSDEVPVWRYEEALKGKTEIKHERKVKVSKEVEYPDRHWWIISDGLFEQVDPPLRDHADIFDLITALNLCIDDPVAFSQNPGQAVGGAFRVTQNALEYRGDLSLGSLPLALLSMNEIPEQVVVSGALERVYPIVKSFRSTSLEADDDMDIRIGLHMYDDALTASLWTAMSNLFFVCENVLCTGYQSNQAERIAEVTDMKLDDAKNWKTAVNRLKHPDKGERITGLLQQPDLEVPSLGYMRKTTNSALIYAMNRRFTESNSSM